MRPMIAFLVAPRHRRALGVAGLVAVPVLYGLLSVAIGQDANWDLRNYHLYNPWALLHGRIGIDLAPAEVPSYFNPLLDVPYHLLASRMPPRALAFLVGAFHGLDVVAVYGIGLLVLTGPSRGAIAVVLALCAGTDNAFTSELGNTMGDATTAVPMLTALAFALRAVTVEQPRPSYGLLVAGLVAGFGVGLKLTNAPYAVGLWFTVCVMRQPWRARGADLVALSIGLFVGAATTYGYWFATLWSHFGNPFYPQYNALFGSPLALATMVADRRFVPSGWLEALAFPFVFTALPIRIYEIPLVNVLWPVAYGLFVAWALRTLWRALRSRQVAMPADDATRRQRFLLVFVGVSYLAWMAVFGIGRYLVTLDLLLPLSVWLLAHRWFTARTARRVAGVALAASLVSVANFRTWGSADFAEAAYRVDVPSIERPREATVLVLTAPVAWILPHFPPELAYVSFGGTFPASPALHERMRSLIEARGGPVYAILPVDEHDDVDGHRTRINRRLERWNVRKDDLLCRYAMTIFAHSTHDEIVFDGPADAPASTACRFRRDFGKRVGLFRDAAAIVRGLAGTGLAIDLRRCTEQRAWIGAAPFPYRFCPVDRVGPLRLDRDGSGAAQSALGVRFGNIGPSVPTS